MLTSVWGQFMALFTLISFNYQLIPQENEKI